MKKENGVTLVALVITVIVILILAGITISLTVGQDGIITKAQQSGIEMKIAEIKDKIKLDILDAETEAIIRGDSLEQAQLNEIIAKYGELQEDGDTIITYENKYKISLQELWNGELSSTGSYTDKLALISQLEDKVKQLEEENIELKEQTVEPTIYEIPKTSSLTHGMKFDLTSIENYQELELYKNIFPVTTAAYASHSGATQGFSITYNAETGIVTCLRNNTSNTIAKPSDGKCYVIVWE